MKSKGEARDAGGEGHLVAAEVHVEIVRVAPLQVRQHRHLARCQERWTGKTRCQEIDR